MTINEEDALQAGINFEKDFMLFLHELKREVVKEGIDVIDSLLDEEVKHLREMFNIKDTLSS